MQEFFELPVQGLPVYAVDVKAGAKKLWDVEAAQFVGDVPEGRNEVYLCSFEGDDSVSYLEDTLKFYGFPLGELENHGLTEAELLARAKAAKTAEFDAAMAGVDQALVRPLSDLLDAMLSPAPVAPIAQDDTGPGAEALDASREKFLRLREIQIRNRTLRADMLKAASVDEVRAFAPVTAAGLATEVATPDTNG